MRPLSPRCPIILAASFALCAAGQAADQGNTTGIASFQAKGEARNHKPAVMVWNGSFVGASVTDARRGPLHSSGWDCTGDVLAQDGTVFRSGGFCLVTDVDGDTVNVLWERTNTPGPATEILTKGTYLSGSGKYAGIKGHYTFSCTQGSAQSVCRITGGSYTIP